MPPFRFILMVVLWVLAVYTTYIAVRGCNNSKPLGEMIERISIEFSAHHIRWTLDYGSLLGMIRDGEMIPFEFDNDITIALDDLDKVMSLKEKFFNNYGYHLYRQGDYMFYKALYRLFAFEWDPYIHSACGRLYDDRHWLYTDIFCDFEFPASELEQQLVENNAKPPTTKDSTYMCQGYDADWCACRAKADMYPVKSIPFYPIDPVSAVDQVEGGRSESESEPQSVHGMKDSKHRVFGDKHDHAADKQGHDQQHNTNAVSKHVLTVNVPNQAESIVEHCYGKDWRTPRPKGIKTLLCVWYVQVLIFALLTYWGVRLYKCYRILIKDRSSLVGGLPIARGKE